MVCNLLVDALIRTRLVTGPATLSLPGVLATAVQGELLGFTALRPHQRHAWHAFLVQIAALALLRAGRSSMPIDGPEWTTLLQGLTPDQDDDAPWSLVAPPDRPALLQPPAPGGIAGWGRRNTADAIDMLITARNHDVKRAAMAIAQPDDWLFALVTLQTMEGYGGSQTYGISRMNGGSSSRPCVGVVPQGGPGAHIRRDVQALVALDGHTRADGFAAQDGLALTWLAPWDGQTSLARRQLDPLYIDVCRRIRLVMDASGLHARTTTSKERRIAEVPGGITGDPWAPLRPDKDGPKNLTMSAESFGYRKVVDLMLADPAQRSALQEVLATDDPAGLSLILRGLVRREQSKTDGYHERRIPLSRVVQRGFSRIFTDADAAVATARVALVGEMTYALRRAVGVLLANGPDPKEDKGKPTDAMKGKVSPFVARLEAKIDHSFFADLWKELEQPEEAPRRQARAAWAQWMLNQADDVLAQAQRSTPRSSALRLRANVRSHAALHGMARRAGGQLAPLLAREGGADAA